MNEFKKFENAYLAILFESSLHEFKKGNKNPFIKKPLYSPKTKNEFKKALKNIKWIYDNEVIKLLYNEDIINESPGSIDYPGTLCDEILFSKNYKNMTNEEVLSFINKNWKYYNELKNSGKLIKIFKFDFSDKNDIRRNFHILNLDEEILNEFINEYFENSNSNGSFMPLGNDIVIFSFNTKNYSKKTILHEFTHYLQYILNVEKINAKNSLNLKKLNFLNLSKEDNKIIINILNDENEVIPYINEFCEDVMNVFKEYIKKFKNVEWSNTFIEFFIKTLLNSEDIRNEEFFKIYQKINNDLTPLYVTLGCFIYNIDLERIKHILYEENKWIENNERSN